MGVSGSSSNAQIFNHSKLKRRIENRTLGLPPPEPIGTGGPDLHYFLLGDDAFSLMHVFAGQALQQTTTDQRRENTQLQDIQGEKDGQELIWYTCQEI